MARLRYNLVQGTLAEDLNIGAPTITLVSPLQEGGVDIPNVVADDILAVRIDSEIMYIVDYTSGDVTATVLRGQEDTVEADHFAGGAVRHVFTKEDVGGGGGGGGFTILIASSVSSDPQMVSRADFVCDGLDDQDELNSALSLIGDSGVTGTLLLAPGHYVCSGTIELPYVTVTIRGETGRRHSRHAPNEVFIERMSEFEPLFRQVYPTELRLERLYVYDEEYLTNTDPLISLESSGSSLYATDCSLYNWQPGGNLIFCGFDLMSQSVALTDCSTESYGDLIYQPPGNSSTYAIFDGGYHWSGTAAASLQGAYDSSIEVVNGAEIWGKLEANSGSIRVENSVVDVIDGTGTYMLSVENSTVIGDSSTGVTINCETGSVVQITNSHINGGKNLVHVEGAEFILKGCTLKGYPDADGTYKAVFVDDSTSPPIIDSNVVIQPSGDKYLHAIHLGNGLSSGYVLKGNTIVGTTTAPGDEILDETNGMDTYGWKFLEIARIEGDASIGLLPKITAVEPSILGPTLIVANTAPTGDDLVVDILVGAPGSPMTSLYPISTKPTVLAGQNNGVASPDIRQGYPLVTFQVDVEQVGSTLPGSDIAIYQLYMPV